MGSIRSEASHLFERRFQAHQCLVEDGCESAEFIFGIVDAKPLFETFRSNQSRLLRHALDRRQSAASQRGSTQPGNSDSDRESEYQHQEGARLITAERLKER